VLAGVREGVVMLAVDRKEHDRGEKQQEHDRDGPATRARATGPEHSVRVGGHVFQLTRSRGKPVPPVM
jgi:hypothetical protein